MNSAWWFPVQLIVIQVVIWSSAELLFRLALNRLKRKEANRVRQAQVRNGG